MDIIFIIIAILIAGVQVEAKTITCKRIKLTRLGCYKDNQKLRPIPELVLTYKDKTSPVYSGEKINWKDWDGYMEKLICNCAAKSVSKGYSIIGLQNYGECWSGPNKVTSRYADDGPSKFCISSGYKKCKGGMDCVGVDLVNFVYRVQKDLPAPTARPTKQPTPSVTRSPTPSHTPSPTPSHTPSPTPSHTPSPTPSHTPSPTPSHTPSPTSKWSTTPGITSPRPSGSGTSTAKRPQTPTKPPKPCYPQSSAGCQQQPVLPCGVPPCLGNTGPQMPYQGFPPLGMSQMQCSAGCPSRCAPQCNSACCRGPMSQPQIPIGYPQGGFQSPLRGQCNRGCPSRCAPRCSIACCQSFGSNMLSPVPYPLSLRLGANFPPVQFSSSIKGKCGAGCSNNCAPRCSIGCCRSFTPPQFQFPQSMRPGPNFSQFPFLGMQQGTYPFVKENRCNGNCPVKCAPKCTIGCCRWFGGLYKKTTITKHRVPSLDDD